jgi:phosphoglycerate-specific signal transduction histidine kinase
MGETSVVTSGGCAADLVDVPDVADAEGRHAEARANLETAEKRLAVDRAALDSANSERRELTSSHRALREGASSAEIARLRGEKAAGIESAVKKLAEVHARIEVSDAVIAALVEEVIPAAEIARMNCDAALKDAAATLIDSRRWQRLREHRKGLDALAESEGAVEIRPARFDEEGRVANELRSEGARLREQRRLYVEKIAGITAAMRQG